MSKLTINPDDYDNQKDFITACIPLEIGAGKDQAQAAAICYSMWEEKGKKKMAIKLSLKLDANEIQTLVDFRKVPEEKLIQEIIICELKSAFIQKYGKELPFTTKYFDEIIENFGNPALSNPKLIANHDGESVKYADIIGLRYDDKWLYAKIKLNYNGYMSLSRGDFDYVSPHFGKQVDTDRRTYNNTLIETSLTNFPALCGDLPSLPEQIKLSKGNAMDALKKLIEYFTQKVSSYKLSKNDTEKATSLAIDPSMLDGILTGLKDIATQLETLISGKAESDAQVAASKTELETKKTEITELTKQLEGYKKTGTSGAAADTTMTVELTKLTNEINLVRTELKSKSDEIELMKKEKLEKEADLIITEAIKLHKIDAVNAEFWTNLYLADPKKVKDELAKIKGLDGSIQMTSNNGTGISLTKAEKKMFDDLGLDASDPVVINAYKSATKEAE